MRKPEIITDFRLSLNSFLIAMTMNDYHIGGGAGEVVSACALLALPSKINVVAAERAM